MSGLSSNEFKTTTINGTLSVIDYSVGPITALFTNNGNSNLLGNVYLGKETGTTGSFVDSGGSIIFKINGITYTLTPLLLSYLTTLSSNAQTQITNINTTLTTHTTALTNISYNTTSLITFITGSSVSISPVGNINFGVPGSGIAQFLGHSSFNAYLPTSNQTPTTGDQLITKTYADTTYLIASSLVSGNYAWTGTNSFNNNLPTSTITPTTGTQFITKNYADSTYSTSSISSLLALNNAWTGTNSFNNNLPTSSLTPTLSTQLITKSYGDTTYLTTSNLSTINTKLTNVSYSTSTTFISGNFSFGSSLVPSTSYISGSCNFFNALPTCSAIPIGVNDLVNKSYCDGQITTVNTSISTINNTITGLYYGGTYTVITTNCTIGDTTLTKNIFFQGIVGFLGTCNFNVNLPTSTLTPTISTQLTTKTYVDSQITTVNSSISTINTTLSTLPSSTILGYLSGITSNIQTQITNITSILPSSIILGYLSGITSNIQTQINTINTTLSTLPSSTILGYLSGITSNIQTQLYNQGLSIASINTTINTKAYSISSTLVNFYINPVYGLTCYITASTNCYASLAVPANDGDIIYIRKIQPGTNPFTITISTLVSLSDEFNITRGSIVMAFGVFEMKFVYRQANTTWYCTTM